MAEKLLDVPDDCLGLIFNQLGHQYHLNAISLVCKRFLSVSSLIKRSLTIFDRRVLVHFNIPNLFQRFRLLKSIDIKCKLCNQDLDRILIDIARSGLNLEELNLSEQSNIDGEGLRELGFTMKKLKTLRSKYCTFNENDLNAIASSFPSLQELDISYPRSSMSKSTVTEEGIDELVSKLKDLRKINVSWHVCMSDRSQFALSSNLIAAPQFRLSKQGLGSALRYCSNLNSLSVSYHNRIERGSQQFPTLFTVENSISYATTLSALEFSSSAISESLLVSISEAHLPLKNLKFRDCSNITFSGLLLILNEYQSLNEFSLEGLKSITDQNMDHLSKFLPSLTHVNLGRCRKLTDSTFFTLASRCPLLADIGMERTSIGQEGNIHVDFRKNYKIQALNLGLNESLNDKSLEKIGSICPNLWMLDISDCQHITEEGIGKILKICPDVRNFKVNRCKQQMILGTDDSRSFKLNIEVLEAKHSWINDKGMEILGMRCPGLLKLGLRNCYDVTARGVKEVVKKCPNLMEIDLRGCDNVGADVLSWMLLTRDSLRKILPPDPSVLAENQIKELSILHGCRVWD